MNNLPIQSTQMHVSDLNANDRFMLPGSHTVYVCDRRSSSIAYTNVWYHIPGSSAPQCVFSRASLSTVYVLND